MWKSGGSKPASVSTQPPAARSRYRGWYRLLVIVVAMTLAVFFLYPLVFQPRIDVPPSVQFGSVSSVGVLIANANLTPLQDVEYTCEIAKLTMAKGSAITDARALTRGFIRKIPARRAVQVRCETSYLVTAPIKQAEYKLTLTYRASPWPQKRTSVYHIAAAIKNSQLTGWKLVGS